MNGSDQIKMPYWFWLLLGGAVIWMTSQSVQTAQIKSGLQFIKEEQGRRILKLEDRVDDLTDRMFRAESQK